MCFVIFSRDSVHSRVLGELKLKLWLSTPSSAFSNKDLIHIDFFGATWERPVLAYIASFCLSFCHVLLPEQSFEKNNDGTHDHRSEGSEVIFSVQKLLEQIVKRGAESCREVFVFFSHTKNVRRYFVTVEILEDRLDEFREVMDLDVTESRKEPACLRFDLLQSADSPLKFHFYEIYKDADGLAAHKETPHYKKWVAFKESGEWHHKPHRREREFFCSCKEAVLLLPQVLRFATQQGNTIESFRHEKHGSTLEH